MATSKELNAALLQFLQENTRKEPTRLVQPKLDPFDEENEGFNTYLQRLDNFLEINSLKGEDDNVKRAQILISCLSPKYFQLLTELTAPDLPKTKSYEELTKLLADYICPVPNEVAEQHKFYSCVQEDGESISTYMKGLRSLTLHCNFTCSSCKSNTIDTHLRTQFIRGLRSSEIREKLLLERNLTLKNAYDIALSMEASRKGSNEICKTETLHKISPQNYKTYNVHKPITFHDLKGKCYRCGKANHKADECKLRNLICSKCNNKGHIATVCLNKNKVRSKGQFQKQLNSQGYNDSAENDPIHDEASAMIELDFHSVSGENNEKYILTPLIDGRPCPMEYDTGAAVSSMSLSKFSRFFPDKAIMEVTNVRLRTYTGEVIELCGTSEVNIQLNKKSMRGRIFVVYNDVDSIFGREWIRPLDITIHDINQQVEVQYIKQDNLVEDIRMSNESLFSDEVGLAPDCKIHLPLRPDARPIFIKHRIPPVALRQKIEGELKCLEDKGIITKVVNSEWGTPIVPILKGDGSLRICADYKITVNPQLLNDHYPIPRIDDIFDKLNGGQFFTTLDLHKAYLHLEMDKESAKLQSISTHVGVFNVNRLMFGIKTAPNIWQRYMDSIIAGLDGTAVFFDDIIVQGRTLEEAKDRTMMVLQRLKENNLHVNRNKSKFFQQSVSYLGHVIDSNGLHKSPNKVEAVLKTPAPTSVTELKQFLGLVNYYHKFLPNLATKLHPLYELLHKKRNFSWTKQCNDVFNDIKQEITTDRVLTTFSPHLPLILATDASPHGLSAVLSHKMPDGSERPIAFASRTLSKAETNYSHIIKEATAIFWGVQKFFHYCYGRHFILITDNKPLSSIFHPCKSLPPLTATRMLHYAVYLSGFDYEIQHRRASDHVNVDYLSRHPLINGTPIDDSLSDKALLQVQLNSLPLTSNQIRKATMEDPELVFVYNALQTSSYINKPSLYRGLEGELTLDGGCIFRGVRVVIPTSLRSSVLQELHTAHTGITKMKELARQYCWWPSIDSDIEKYVDSCKPCALNKNNPPKYHQPWESSKIPWERVHIDHAGPFKGSYFFIAVDSCTKWLEVQETKSITTFTTVKILKEMFARFGIPNTVVSDNGPAFISSEFKQFMTSNGIHHKLMAAYHPASNGQAERYVQTLKKKIRAMADEPGDSHTNLCRFLLQNRKVINSSTGRSPAEMMFKRNIRTKIDLLKVSQAPEPNEVLKNLRQFTPGDGVQIRDYRGHQKWKFGSVVSRIGVCHYLVSVNGGSTVKCHVDQLRSTRVPQEQSDEPNSEHKNLSTPALPKMQRSIKNPNRLNL